MYNAEADTTMDNIVTAPGEKKQFIHSFTKSGFHQKKKRWTDLCNGEGGLEWVERPFREGERL